MIDNNLEILQGLEHKASYKTITSSKLDSKALKVEYPDIAAQYMKETISKRFIFN